MRCKGTAVGRRGGAKAGWQIGVHFSRIDGVKQQESVGRLAWIQRAVMAVLALAVVIGVAVSAVVVLRPRSRAVDVHDQPPGFYDATEASGIRFQMAFLPNEQGENFRVNLYDHGAGLAVGDYDGDGDDDLLFLNQLGGNVLYNNRGDGSFEEVTDDAGPLAADRICVAAAFADYDNDGDQDLYITSTRGGNVLLSNDGRGHYSDETEAAGVACVAHSQAPVFFDYDNDGDLDLFVANTAKWTTDEFDEEARYYRGSDFLWTVAYDLSIRESNRLFRNLGDGTFDEVAGAAGLAGRGWSGDVATFDYDDDGYLDVFVTNMCGRDQLYHNDGHGHFDDVTEAALGRTSYGSVGCAAFDFNNDARTDLFVADMHSDMWFEPGNRWSVEPRQKYRHRTGPDKKFDRAFHLQEQEMATPLSMGEERFLFGNTLFCNDGGGRFSEISDAAGMETFWPWGVAVGDFDNDGFLDAFVPSGMGYPYIYWPSSLMMNQGNEAFVDRADSEGIEPPAGGEYLPQRIAGQLATRSARCAATADFNGDGRLDLVVNNFNDRATYFQNQFPPHHYIAFRLRGTRSNRDAVGAAVTLYAGERVMLRQAQSTGGYLSQSSKTLHFGLGDADSVDRVEIRWPSGKRQTLLSPKIDRLHDVTEPE